MATGLGSTFAEIKAHEFALFHISYFFAHNGHF
jgi:hypothetical protein